MDFSLEQSRIQNQIGQYTLLNQISEPEIIQEVHYLSKGLQNEQVLSDRRERIIQTGQNTGLKALNDQKKVLIDFIQQLGKYKNTSIRQDILEYANSDKKEPLMPNTLPADNLLKLVQERIQKMLKSEQIKKNWCKSDLKILVWVVSKYAQLYGIQNVSQHLSSSDWKIIGKKIPGTNGKICRFKFLSLKRLNIIQKNWEKQQSLLLNKIASQYKDKNWNLISERLFEESKCKEKIYRNPKQCRQHWDCYLAPQIKKGFWQKNQDYLLLRAVKQLNGQKKWVQIAKILNGRTQNALKNRFTLLINNQKANSKKSKLTQIQIVQSLLAKFGNTYTINQQLLKSLRQRCNQIKIKTEMKKQKKLALKRTIDTPTIENEQPQIDNSSLKLSENRQIEQNTPIQMNVQDFQHIQSFDYPRLFIDDQVNNFFFTDSQIYKNKGQIFQFEQQGNE